MDTPSIPQRKCTKCKLPFPATLEYFYPCKAGKYGLGSWCKTCHRDVNKKNTHEWYQDNKEHISEYGKQYRIDNAGEIAEYSKQYYQDNIEHERERSRIKYIVKFDEYRPRRLERGRKHYHDNVSTIRPKAKARRAHKMETDPSFRARIKIVAKQGKATRRAREANASGSHTAADILLQRKSQTDKRGRLRCWWCGSIIKDEDYHLDHSIPLSRGGSNAASNLVISCPTCNLKKNDKTPQEWAGTLL